MIYDNPEYLKRAEEQLAESHTKEAAKIAAAQKKKRRKGKGKGRKICRVSGTEERVRVRKVGKEVILKATIKEHKEYLPKNSTPETKPIRQNLLTRCEQVEFKNFICLLNERKHTVEALNELEARKLLRGILGVSKLPRGLKIVEDKPEPSVTADNENELSLKI